MSNYEELQEYWDNEQILHSKTEPNITPINSVLKDGGTTNSYPRVKPIIGVREKPVFPLDALPVVLREAVLEIEDYVQAPTALIVSSLLGICSAIVQGLIKVRRDNALVSPTSLYILIIAEPNERKSFIERYFRSVIEKWEVTTQKMYTEKQYQYAAEQVSFEAKQKSLEKQINANTDNPDELKRLTKELAELMSEKPIKPLVPKMLFGDATKEALTKSLDENYPSGAIISAEGGGILAGALTRDGLTGVLATLNSLWSGETVTINRSGDGDRILKNVALTLSIEVQEAVILEFLSKGKEMARGIGFLARTLFCFPESTQGKRPYKKPSENNFGVDALNDRLNFLISMVDDYVKNRRLSRKTIPLDDEAKQVWIKYYNTTEALQRKGENLEFLRDVAGKTADNATRLAGIFHALEYEGEIDGCITATHMTMGCQVAEYYLHEALNYLDSSELPEEFKNAQDISERLVSYCMKRKQKGVNIDDGLLWHEITHRGIQRIAPRKISDKKSIAPILVELEDAGHIVSNYERGKSIVYVINPALVNTL